MADARRPQPAGKRQQEPDPVAPMALVGLLAWLVPGAGHWYLGMRARGAIIFVTIGAMFWAGLGFGAVRGLVDPRGNGAWFASELGTGGNALIALAVRESMTWTGHQGQSWGKSRDVGQVYAGVAGLLNLICIFDAIVRAISGNVYEVDPKRKDEEPPQQA